MNGLTIAVAEIMPNKVRVHVRIRVSVRYLKAYPRITLLIRMSVERYIMQRDEHPTLPILDRFETARGEGLGDFVDGRLNVGGHNQRPRSGIVVVGNGVETALVRDRHLLVVADRLIWLVVP
jgi:hypothetical protein